MKRRLLAGLVLISLLLSGCSVSAGAGSTKLTKGMEKKKLYESKINTEKEEEAYLYFAANLLKKAANKDENILVSPLSVLYALGMTANGADGSTLSEMEAVFGLAVEDMNAFLQDFVEIKEKKAAPLQAANSIWIKEDKDFKAERTFLEKMVSVYGAEVFTAPFNKKTKDEINAWVKKNTGEMIEQILDEISDDAVMYLINALTFKEAWEMPYKDYQIKEREFTCFDGEKTKVSMMHSEENQYFETERAEGFVKDYESEKFAFMGVLPKEGISLREFLDELSGEEIRSFTKELHDEPINSRLPSFKSECDLKLNEILIDMSMKSAFDETAANFKRLGRASGNIYISKVLHKAVIEVGKEGTKAAAATAVEMDLKSAPIEEPKRLEFNRPFLYMILEKESGLPIFMGAIFELGK